MYEEKTSSHMPMQRSMHQQNLSSSSSSSGGLGNSLSSLSAVEARLSGQLAHAASQHEAHQAAQSNGIVPPSLLPTLPLSNGSTPLRPSTVAANQSSQGGSISTGEIYPLEWADQQFKRAGMNSSIPTTDRHQDSMPIQNLGQYQRIKHANMFKIVEKLREGQQHIFLEQFNQ